jgi:flagellum-specific peptidoglycan hydrolase FlgJ
MKTLVSILILFGLWISPLRKSSAEKPTPAKSVDTTEQLISRLLIQNGVKFHKIVLLQSKLESGYYKSRIFKENRNTFGMKLSKRGYATGKHLGHARYNSLEDCVADYAQWQRERLAAHERKYGPVNSEERYYFFLNHLVIGRGVYSYAEDISYTNKLRKLRM